MTLDEYYDWACDDAARRGQPGLKPVIEALRTSARQLRQAPWNDDAAASPDATSPGTTSVTPSSETQPSSPPRPSQAPASPLPSPIDPLDPSRTTSS